jgi:hypothetical protein
MYVQKTTIFLSFLWAFSLTIIQVFYFFFDGGIGHGGINPLMILSPIFIIIGIIFTVFQFFLIYRNKDKLGRYETLAKIFAWLSSIVPIAPVLVLVLMALVY